MEINILLWFQNCVRQEWLTPIMEIISFLGKGGWFFIATALILCFKKSTRKIGVCILVAIALQVLFNNGMLKPLIHRTRPYEAYSDVLQLIGTKETDYSFPSGHTGIAFVWAYGLYISCNKKKWGIAAIVLAILMGISRMYLGFHYPSDVLAAVVLGIVCAIMGYAICKKYIYPKMKG